MAGGLSVSPGLSVVPSEAPVATTITATGTTAYPIPTGATRIEVTLWGAGGGGGSGRCGVAGAARSGGLGGWGGVPVTKTFPVSALSGPVTVTVGTGGAGGAAVSATADGNPGVAGGNTTFGAYLRALGGYGGLGGTAAGTTFVTGAASIIQSGGMFPPQGTSVTAAATQVASPVSVIGGAPGGSGGSLSTGNAELLGGVSAWAGVADPALVAPDAPAAAGVAGAAGRNSAVAGIAGYGGNGGGPSAAGTAGAGGAGGRGSGGGGGGASVNGQSSGAGGAGGDGMAYIVAYFD